MEKINLFEFAVRNKLRFPFKGSIDVEQLWQLDVEDLDTVFKTLNAQAKEAKEESLLATKSANDLTLEVQIEIVKHIVATKIAEKEAHNKSIENAAERQKILAILADKRDAALKDKSEEELLEMLKKLDN